MNNIQHHPDNNRFTLSKEDGEEIGYLEYRLIGNSWNITETRIAPQYRGQGLAHFLVSSVIKEADKLGVNITASCDYAEQVIARLGR